MIGSRYFFLTPLSTVSIAFNYLPKVEHHFEVEPVSYKKLSSPRVRPPLIISLFLGCLTMVSTAATIQFYWPLTFRSAGFSVHATTGDLNRPNPSQPSIHVFQSFGRRCLLCVTTTIKLVFKVKTWNSYSKQVNKINKIPIPLTKSLYYIEGGSNVTSLRATLDNGRSGCSYIKALRKIIIESKWYNLLKIRHVDTSINFKEINATLKKIKKMKLQIRVANQLGKSNVIRQEPLSSPLRMLS